jgi:hypothetical protein
MLTVINEVTYDIDTKAVGQVVGEAREEGEVVDGDVDEDVEDLDDEDFEEDSVTTHEHALDSLEADDVQALAKLEGVETAFPGVRYWLQKDEAVTGLPIKARPQLSPQMADVVWRKIRRTKVENRVFCIVGFVCRSFYTEMQK